MNYQMQDLSLILSPTDDINALTRALTKVHNDVILHGDTVIKQYVLNGIIDGIVRLCRSCRDTLVNSLAVSLANAICHNNEDALLRFHRLGGSAALIGMISSRDNYGEDPVMFKRTLLLHEKAAQFLMHVSEHNSPDVLGDLVGQGIIPRVVQLCTMFHADSEHSKCCVNKAQFSNDAIDITKHVIENRTLVGKVYTDLSQESDSLKIYTVDLFDTSTDKDVCINQELVMQGFAWPDPLPPITEECLRKRKLEAVKVEGDEVFTDIIVKKVIDAHCFWAHVGGAEVKEKVKGISSLLDEWTMNNKSSSVKSCTIGDNIFFGKSLDTLEGDAPTGTTFREWYRGRVLKIDPMDRNCASVLAVDHGLVFKLRLDQMYELPTAATNIPYKASLCNLKGLQARPRRTKVLEYAAGIITNITRISNSLRSQLNQVGGGMALLQLCQLPDADIVKRSVQALTNLCRHRSIKPMIGSYDGCAVILDLCRTHLSDTLMLKLLLGCILHLSIECIANRARLAERDALLVLMHVYRSHPHDDELQDLVLKCMKNLVGDGWRLIDPINVPDVRGVCEDQIDGMKGAFDLNNLCGESMLNEAIKMRKAGRIKEGSTLPNPIFASLSINDLMSKLDVKENERDANVGCSMDSRNKQEQETPITESDDDDDVEDGMWLKNRASLLEYDGYIYKRKTDFIEDERHEFVYEKLVRNVKAVNIARSVCAFLNSGKGGVIYIGINDGRMDGININRKERDNLRLGIDDLLSRFDPVVRHDKYEIKFEPVMKGFSVSSLKQYEERYVVEVIVSKSTNTIYHTTSKKIFYREGKKNVEVCMQDIRQKTIEEAEEKFQGEIKALRLSLTEARVQLDAAKQNKTD